MKAKLLLHRRFQVGENAFAEIKLWRVPQPVRGSAHDFRYALAFVVGRECVLRYDNEPGKGDHKHVDGRELPYEFVSPARLIRDFRRDVQDWKAK